MVFVVFGCSVNSKEDTLDHENWSVKLTNLGSSSSPRTADLNGDGILDIVVGAGREEFLSTDSAIVALDGRNGNVMWTYAARDQIFGSPTFKDISKDGIEDIFIGGRSAEFLAIDGRSGRPIWEFFPEGDTTENYKYKLYNFYQPQFIADQTSDGIEDILVSNGGYIKAPPGDPNRPPGKLMIIDASNGDLISEAYMPDGKETYMSVVLSDFGSKTQYVIFGSGGETVAGSLYKTKLSDVLEGTLDNSIELVRGKGKGFIAPPVLVDITGDQIDDVIVNAVDGRMIAIDGISNETLWETKINNTEAYCSIAVGQFTNDSIPDFFTNFGIGQFPNLMRSYQMMVDGSNGKIKRFDSLGNFHYSSPVVFDFTNDGKDDVLYTINNHQYGAVSNSLKVFDFENDTSYNINETLMQGANMGSTPWIGDLNGDNRLEIIHVHENNPVDFFSWGKKTGIAVHKITTGIIMKEPVQWGSYMGSMYNGKY